jgi:hypothetical protein
MKRLLVISRNRSALPHVPLSSRVLPIAVVTLALLAGCGGVGTPPSTTGAGSVVPTTLASGSFTAPFGAIDIEATGSGADVSGDMRWSQEGNEFSLDLQCSRTTNDGVLLIGGEVMDVTHPEMAEGDRVSLALKPGTPVQAVLWAEETPADSCEAFLEGVPDRIANDLQPVVGDVELGP